MALVVDIIKISYCWQESKHFRKKELEMALNYKNLLNNLHISFFVTFFLLFLLIFSFSGVLQAENDLAEGEALGEQEELENEIHLEWDEVGINRRNYFPIKANLGYQLGFLRFNLRALNSSLQREELPSLPEFMIVRGFQGKAGAALSHRLGLYMTGGELKNSAAERQTILNFDHRGLFYLKGVYADNKADIALGLGLGRAGLRLTAVHRKPEREIYGEPSSSIYEASFFVLQPRAVLQYKVLPLAVINIGLESFLGVNYSGWSSHGFSTEVPPLNNFFSYGITVGLSLGL